MQRAAGEKANAVEAGVEALRWSGRAARRQSVAPALMMMPLTPAASMPPSTPSARSMIDFVIVTAPKPPGSSTLISPWAAVFEIAPAKVLHGAVRLHGLASSPTPETQVRDAWAEADEANATRTRTAASTCLRFISSPCSNRPCEHHTRAPASRNARLAPGSSTSSTAGVYSDGRRSGAARRAAPPTAGRGSRCRSGRGGAGAGRRRGRRPA